MAKTKIKFMHRPNCRACRKAKAFLEKKKAELEVRDLGKDKLSIAELDELIGAADHRKFLNTRNELYRTRKMAKNPPSRDEALKLMAAQPNLTPPPLVLPAFELLRLYDQQPPPKLPK